MEPVLGIGEQGWENIQDAMEPHRIKAFRHLVQRLDMKAVEAMVEESRENQEASSKKQEVSARRMRRRLARLRGEASSGGGACG